MPAGEQEAPGQNTSEERASQESASEEQVSEEQVSEEQASEEQASEEQASEEQASEEPVYVISIAAKLAGLPSWTLRVLDKEGIVRPKRTLKDRRLYSDRDIELLARIRYLTEERGVNMNGVKLILEMEGVILEPTEH